jgi:PAS domain S-box-containing protein
MEQATVMDISDQVKAVLDGIGEWWGYIVSFFGAVGVVVGVFRKHIWKVVKGAFLWVRAAATLPTTLQQIQADLQLEMTKVNEHMVGMRRAISFETAARRSLMQASRQAYFETDKDGKVLWANTELLKLTSRLLSQFVGGGWRNSVATPDREYAIEEFAASVRDGVDCRMKFRLQTGDETETWVLFDAICNKDDLGNILGFVGTVKEIGDPAGER